MKVGNKYWIFNIRKWSLYVGIVFITTIAISWFLAYKIIYGVF